MKKLFAALLIGLLLVPTLSQATDFTDTDQVYGVGTAGTQASQFWQTWALHKVQMNEEFTATTPSTGDILQWSGTVWAASTPTSLPADELVMNPIEWHFNSDQLGAAATVPDEAMTYRVPYDVDYDTVWVDCGKDPLSATHDGSAEAAVLTDSTATWTIDALIGEDVRNVTDGSSCEITDNTATTITCTLAGGTDNDWDVDDVAEVYESATSTSLAIDISSAATRYGMYTDEGSAITTVGSSVDVSSYGSLTAGQYISARVSTASTGDATMCNLQLILTTN